MPVVFDLLCKILSLINSVVYFPLRHRCFCACVQVKFYRDLEEQLALASYAAVNQDGDGEVGIYAFGNISPVKWCSLGSTRNHVDRARAEAE